MSDYYRFGLKKDGAFKLTVDQLESGPVIQLGRLMKLIDVVRRYASLELRLFFDAVIVESETEFRDTKRKTPQKGNYLHQMAEAMYGGPNVPPLHYVAPHKIVIFEGRSDLGSRYVLDLDNERLLVGVKKLIFTLSFAYLREEARENLESVLQGMVKYHKRLMGRKPEALREVHQSFRTPGIVQEMGQYDIPADCRSASNIVNGYQMLVTGAGRSQKAASVVLTLTNLHDNEMWWHDTNRSEKETLALIDFPASLNKSKRIR